MPDDNEQIESQEPDMLEDDAKEEILTALRDVLNKDELEGILAKALKIKSGEAEVRPSSDNGSKGNGKGTFQEPETKDVSTTDKYKLDITDTMLHKSLEGDLDSRIPFTEIPGCTLMPEVLMKTRSDWRNPIYRAKHPTETLEECFLKNKALHMRGFNRKGNKETLQIMETEAEKDQQKDMGSLLFHQ